MTPRPQQMTPAKPGKPAGWLLFLEGDPLPGPLLVNEGPNVLGRDRESCESWRNQAAMHDCAILVLADPSVSRVHLLIEAGPAGVTVKDLKSANKTLLGGAELTPMKAYPLADRARLSVAQLPALFVKFPSPGDAPVTDSTAVAMPAPPPRPPPAAGETGLAARLADTERTAAIYREQLLAAEKFARDLELQVARLLQPN